MAGFRRQPAPEPERRQGIAENGLPFESVWDYPRPPAILPEPRQVLVKALDATIASSERALRVCETAGAPVVYIPEADLNAGFLLPASGGGSFCEWKGAAVYLDVNVEGQVIRRAAWTYPRPSPGFEKLAGYVAFYPGLVECRLAGETVSPQPGGFYGGWITAEITGPVKGTPGSEGW